MNPLTIVLVPGAFHVASSIDLLSLRLQETGYDTCTWGLTTINNPAASVTDDVFHLAQDVLKPLIEVEGKDVVLYLHSYAGFPGSAAIAGFAKAERVAVGQKGGIVSLIYQAAFVPKEGTSLNGMIGGDYPPWQDPDEKTGLVRVKDPKQTFHADVPEPLATEAGDRILCQSMRAFTTPSGPVHYQNQAYDGCRVYLHSMLDQAIPAAVQDMFVNGSGTSWEVRRLEMGHNPFLSQPAKLAEIIEECVRGFEARFWEVKV